MMAESPAQPMLQSTSKVPIRWNTKQKPMWRHVEARSLIGNRPWNLHHSFTMLAGAQSIHSRAAPFKNWAARLETNVSIFA